MRRLFILAAAVLILSPGRAAGAQQDPAQALREAEAELAAALIANDEAAFERLLLPGFLMRGAPDVDRATWIANALDLCWGSQAVVSEFTVIERRDDVAIVGLILTSDRHPDTCERATVSSLLTDVWHLENGRWRLALRHSGPAGDVAAQFATEDPPPPLIEGAAELSLVNTGGNSDTKTLGAGGTLIWRPGAWRTDARVAFVRTATDAVETARQLSARIEQSRPITGRLDAFGRVELRVDRFAGISRRVSLDAGLGYRPLDSGGHAVRLSAGVGYSTEDRVAVPGVSSGIANLGATWRWTVTDSSTLSETSLVTASLDDGDDWRVGNALSFTTTVSRVFSVKLTHELKFVNRPAPGFRKTDTILSAALVARF